MPSSRINRLNVEILSQVFYAQWLSSFHHGREPMQWLS
jgi:hypothetical protein